jgi:hypothetical protein
MKLTSPRLSILVGTTVENNSAERIRWYLSLIPVIPGIPIALMIIDALTQHGLSMTVKKRIGIDMTGTWRPGPKRPTTWPQRRPGNRPTANKDTVPMPLMVLVVLCI